VKYFRKTPLIPYGGMLLLAAVAFAASAEVSRPAPLSVEQGRTALQFLVGAANDPDPEVRAAVADAWGEIANPAALPLLKKAVKDADPYVRIEAAASLNKLGSPEGSLALEAMVGKSTAAAARLKPAEEMKQMARAKVRAAAILKLSEMGSERVVALLEKTLKDRSGLVRDATAVALCRLGFDEFADGFLDVLADPDESVRAAAVTALGQTRLALGLEALRQASGDPSPAVRAEAIKGLGGYPAADVLEDLQRGLKDDQPRVRLLAATALSRLEDPLVIPVLREQLKEGVDPAVQLMAVRGLAAQGEKVDISLPARQISSKDVDGRMMAMEALAAIKTGPALEMLIEAVERDPSPRCRVHAATLTLKRLRAGARP
jgi:HEAT repeat protein